jgi:hypothetical protein
VARFRRLALALLLVQLIQLLLPGAAAACTRMSGDSVANAPATDAHAGHDMPAPEPGEGERHHLPTHCPAAMACGVAALASGEIGIDERGVNADADIVARDDARPLSPTQAPEPPPPRA